MATVCKIVQNIGVEMKDIIIGAATHKGKKRQINQDFYDCYIPRDPKEMKKGALLVLADGMGGYSGGEVASKMAVEILMNNYYDVSIKKKFKSMKSCFHMANISIMNKAVETPSLKGMGTTLTAVVIKNNKLYCAHVGDSRAYFVSEKGLIQLTQDHSYVASLVRQGVITEEQAETHPERNMITRAIGVTEDLEIDCLKKTIHPRKTPYLLICCDGLYREVDNQTIIDTIFSMEEPQSICDQLVLEANNNGGSDNITVIVAKFNHKNFVQRWFTK